MTDCNNLETDHEQVSFTVTFHVDVGIARLLKLIWDKGLMTQYSCEGDINDKETLIVFPNYTDACYFACFLEQIGVSYLAESRAFCVGFGASISFSKLDMAFIEDNLSTKEGQFWDFIHPNEAQKLYSDYKERFKLDQDNWEIVKVFGSPKIPDWYEHRERWEALSCWSEQNGSP